jgi:hypothetical protein
MRCLIFALSIAAVVGCRAPKEPVQVVEADVIRPDEAQLVREMSADRKGTRDRYVGKVIEIEIDGIDVNAAKGSKVDCDPRMTGSSPALSYEAVFDLNDELNASLKGRQSGTFSAVIRGVVRAIDGIDNRSNIFVVKLDPAWIPPQPRRSVLSIVRDNSIAVFCLFGSIFLGVTTFRIAWRQDWGWFWGIVLTAIIVGISFLFWPWGLLGAGAIVGKLYKSYG